MFKLIRRLLRYSVVRFGIVGVVVMLAFMGMNWLLEPVLGKYGAFLVAYPPALALHFCLNKWWTFGCERTDSTRQVGEYLVMAGVTFLIQAAVFAAVTSLTKIPSWIASGIANVTQMVVTFFVMKWRVFAPSISK